MIQETNETKTNTNTGNQKKGTYYDSATKWYVSLTSADITLRPMNATSDRPVTAEHMVSVLQNIRSIRDTKGDACTVTCRIDFANGNVSFFHYFMDGGCEKELRGKVFEELKTVQAPLINRNGSEADLDELFS